MITVKELKRRTKTDLKRRLYERTVFRRDHMKQIAKKIVSDYIGYLSDEELLHIGEQNEELKMPVGQVHAPKQMLRVSATPSYPGEKIGNIYKNLGQFLERELKHIIDIFWEGRTSVEFAVQSSGAELVGFYNGKHPSVGRNSSEPFEEMLMQSNAPYA